jgi:hypothetical protein
MSATFTPPRWEVADVLRAHAATYLAQHGVSPEQARVLCRLQRCRTAALGGHVDSCGQCGVVRVSYNSCRDRHCPKCQAGKRAQWLQERLQRLLPVPYFHVVFTLPEQLRPLLLHNARQLYRVLFDAASATINTLAADPKRLGAQVGMTAILHTWGQNLSYHPHLHCVVTGGGLALDGQRWIDGNQKFFLPVRVLSKLFRGKFLGILKALHRDGDLSFPKHLTELSEPLLFRHFLKPLYERPWLVYAKRPFGSAEHVFRYLGRYSHRVAISNHRLIEVTDRTVSFTWKDYAAGHQRKVLTLAADEFIRRFLFHVLPTGFVRIRHYGLLASINIKTKWARSRELLGQPVPTTPPPQKSWVEQVIEWFGFHPLRCPHCQAELVRRPLEPKADYHSAGTPPQPETAPHNHPNTS